MESKNISESAKAKFLPILNKYTMMLIEGFKEDGIIQEIENPDGKGGKTYQLVQEIKQNISIGDAPKTENSQVISSFLEFRDILKAVFININSLSSDQIDKLMVSDMIDSFEKLSVFKIANRKSRSLTDIFNKGKRLLDDETIQKETIELFANNNLNFSRYTSSLLEYYTKEKLISEFQGFELIDATKIVDINADVVLKNKNGSEYDLIFEIKYRRKALSTLKEDVFQGLDLLTKYDSLSEKENTFVLILYCDEGSSVLEKLEFRFRQYVDEFFPSYSDRLFFIALYSPNLHLLPNEFKRLQISLSEVNNKLIELSLTNQSPPPGKTHIDDHYFDASLDLSRNSYEITVTPTIQIPHWRVGLKFSKENIFPSREERHIKDYPLFHLEKNINSTELRASYYDETNHQKYSEPSLIDIYRQEPVTIKVAYNKNIALIDVVDKNGDSILKKTESIPNFPWCQLLAWGDSKNAFNFKIIVKEKKLNLPSSIVKTLPKKKTESFSVKVIDSENVGIGDAHVLLLAENNTFLDGKTSNEGNLELAAKTNRLYSVLVAHKEYLSSILEKIDLTKDLEIKLAKSHNAGSIICSNGTGNIPGLDGRLNPILDSANRTYFYADNIAISGGKQQPVQFEIDNPVVVEDKNGTNMKLIFRLIRGRTSLIDFVKQELITNSSR